MVVPVLGHDAVLAAVSPGAAIEHVRDAFAAHHAGAWTMPSKVYLQAPPAGDFRAMPALGGGFAMLKWISSFPGNPAAHGLPTVMGIVCLSDAGTSEPRMLLDARAVTALRTGAVAAVAADALSRDGATSVGVIGCGLHGAWAARCLAAAGYGPGKAEATIEAIERCALFCDEWAQASHGGELTGAVEAGVVAREQVTDLGAVLAGAAPGRAGADGVTLFDSTGLAIQDLAIAIAAHAAWSAGRVEAQQLTL